MEITKIKVNDTKGLHMRNAAKIVQTAKKYKSKIYLCRNCKLADSCSILEVLTLAAVRNSEIGVIVEGPDEKEALKGIVELFSDGAGI
jgi:phosphocarrier protein